MAKNKKLKAKKLPLNLQEKMLKEEIRSMIEILKVLGDRQKREILDFCYKKPMKISELQKKTGLNYREVWEKVNLLSKNGGLHIDCLITEKKENEKGRPVFVKSKLKSRHLVGIIRAKSWAIRCVAEDYPQLFDRIN